MSANAPRKQHLKASRDGSERTTSLRNTELIRASKHKTFGLKVLTSPCLTRQHHPRDSRGLYDTATVDTIVAWTHVLEADKSDACSVTEIGGQD